MILNILLHGMPLAMAATTNPLGTGKGPFTAAQCGKAAEAYKFIPAVSAGAMNEKIFQQFMGGGCLLELCHYWSGKFKKVDNATAGADIAAAYASKVLGCAKVVAAEIHQGTETCQVLNEQFTYAPDAGKDAFADIPVGLQVFYDDNSCQADLKETKPAAKDNAEESTKKPSNQKDGVNPVGSRKGPFTPEECASFAEAFNFVPVANAGNMTEAGVNQFLAGGCAGEICHYWADKFTTVDVSTAGKDIATAYTSKELNCETVVAENLHFATATCEDINKLFTFDPTSKEAPYGDIPVQFQDMYNKQKCYDGLCIAWEDKYTVTGGKLGSKAPKGFQDLYTRACAQTGSDPSGKAESGDGTDSKAGATGGDTAGKAEIPAVFDVKKIMTPEECGALYESSGIIATNVDAASAADVTKYREGGCNINICYYWKTKYGIVLNEDWGTTPEDVKAAYKNTEIRCGDILRAELTPENLSCEILTLKFHAAYQKKGYMTAALSRSYQDMQCENQETICGILKKEYGIVPGESWGPILEADEFLNYQVSVAWGYTQCKDYFAQALPDKGAAKGDPAADAGVDPVK